jgi:hypothetical protein
MYPMVTVLLKPEVVFLPLRYVLTVHFPMEYVSGVITIPLEPVVSLLDCDEP